MRHSESLKYNNVNNSDSLQIQNEKWPLSENGEDIAKEKSKDSNLCNFDVVISSNYVRAISTAKYFTKDKINIDERFGERKFGIDNWNELPTDFGERQFNDFNYKIRSGESLNDVIKREEEALSDILNNYKEKKILIVGHSTALAALFSKWCKINYDGPYTYNDKVFFDGKWNYCETFKLEFDDNNCLISIKNIK
jgi:2,3-bisphosphoglycerate-dependent phosphoglycerate mutase